MTYAVRYNGDGGPVWLNRGKGNSSHNFSHDLDAVEHFLSATDAMRAVLEMWSARQNRCIENYSIVEITQNAWTVKGVV